MTKSSEEKEIKALVKKANKKLKNVQEREAKLELEKNKLERLRTCTTLDKELETNNNEKESKNESCNHSSTCISRQPFPPLFGPKTLEQHELEEAVLENETKNFEIESLVEDFMNLFNTEPKDDLDFTIVKLEIIQNLLESKISDKENESLKGFQELIDKAKKNKQDYENAKEYMLATAKDDDDYSDYEDYSVPRHFYVDEDGSEFIFEDEILES